MAEYQLIATPAAGVMKGDKWIHEDADVPNPEWTEFQEWLKAGNVPDPAQAPAPAEKGAPNPKGLAAAPGAKAHV